MEMIMVYITAKDRQQARTIGRTLVEERLCACVNIIDGMESIYWWKGSISSDSETVLIAKTRRSLFDKLSARVRVLHTYDCPCIVALPILTGSAPYLAWLEQETEPG